MRLKQPGIEICLKLGICGSLGFRGRDREIRKVAHRVVVHVGSERFDSDTVVLYVSYRDEFSYVLENSLCKEF